MNRTIFTLFFVSVLSDLVVAEPKFEAIFDGKALEGWKAPNMSYWSVEDGAITAQCTEDNPCTKNQFLVWQGGEIANFVLKFKLRLEGGPRANSGVQIRSAIKEDGHAEGYQADITFPDGQYLGALYDEHTGRKTLAARGQRTLIEADGTRETKTVESPEEASAGLDLSEWTDYEIEFIGDKVTIKIGGKLMSEVIDQQEGEAEASGLLALQLHSGPPMKVQFKDLQLKKLP
ncbi:MAG: DUF1080 domain-containing protein [Verrucomicrobiota bacterium]